MALSRGTRALWPAPGNQRHPLVSAANSRSGREERSFYFARQPHDVAFDLMIVGIPGPRDLKREVFSVVDAEGGQGGLIQSFGISFCFWKVLV